MNKLITLTQQVRQKITNRIILGSLLFICMFLVTTGYDVYENVQHLSNSITRTSQELSKFITSQKLIDNEQAIFYRLDQMSRGVIQYQWIPPGGDRKLEHEELKKIVLTKILNWTYIYKIPKVGEEGIGYIKISGSLLKDRSMLRNFFIRVSILALFFSWALIILYPLARKIPNELFIIPIREILNILRSSQKRRSPNSTEIPLAVELQTIQDEILNLIQMREIESQREALLTIATQVAHDIRSPLAAINTALLDISAMSENRRILVKGAIRSINDIANNLLLHARNKTNPLELIEESNNYPELVFIIVDNLISEKRYEYPNSDIRLQLDISNSCYNSFARINIGSFKRLLSNLINNSMESVSSNGLIRVSVDSSDETIVIDIEDNGCGIPADILPKVTQQGFSFNKKRGSGCGLSFAKHYLEQINGSMHIFSEEKIGTTIHISLIRSDSPKWFCDSLHIDSETTIIVLDDDPSIHDTWNVRFAAIPHVKIIHFYKVSELLEYELSEIPLLYLVDYEFADGVKNGLDVIEELHLNNKAFLVTSCFEDISIRNRCEKLGVSIIPKTYVPYIKITQITKWEHTCGVVLIDDNVMMHMTWALAAADAGLNIATYSSFDEFVNEINNYDKKTIIYIDSELGNNIKGEDCAKSLFDKGYSEVYLTTGHPKDQFEHIPWIKSVVGKIPPFSAQHCPYNE